jgi:hypothetical protein
MRPAPPLAALAVVLALAACDPADPAALVAPARLCRVDGMLVPPASDSLRPAVASTRAAPDEGPGAAASTPGSFCSAAAADTGGVPPERGR